FFPGCNFWWLSAGQWIVVPSRTAGLARGSSVLPNKRQVASSRTEAHARPFSCQHAVSKVRCWLEFRVATGWQSRRVAPQVSHLRKYRLSDMVRYLHCGWIPFSRSPELDGGQYFTFVLGRSRRCVSSQIF